MHKFYCTLTGDAETPALSDLTLPVSSISLRRTSAGAFLSAVVPGIDYAGDIAARSNGNLQITWSFAGYGIEVLANVPLTGTILYEGAASASVSLKGEDTETAWVPGDDAVIINHVLSKAPNQTGGKYTYQIAGPFAGLIPGVDVTYGDHTFELGEFQLEIAGDNMGVYIKEA